MAKILKFPKAKQLQHTFKAEPKPKPKRINNEMIDSFNKELNKAQGIKHYMGWI